MERFGSYPLVAAMLLCYLGYPAFRVSVLVFGLGGGACLGYVLGKGLFTTEIAAGVSAAVGALVGTLLLRLFVRTGLFFAGGGAGAAAGMALGLPLPGILAVGLCSAIFTLFAARWVLMLSTSLAGAAWASAQLAGTDGAPLESPRTLGTLLLTLFFFSGLAVQVVLTRTRS